MTEVTDPTTPSGPAAARLVDMLSLESLGREDSVEKFRAPVSDQAFWRVFGGQVLAQSARAAINTVDSERLIHSVHGYFLRPGDANAPIEISVESLRDGRSFSARRSQAYQNGKPILSMISSFQKPSAGLYHQLPMPSGIPDPEELAPPEELIGHVKHPIMQEWSSGRPFEIRHVDRPIYIEADRDARPSNAVWMRTRDPLPDDLALHQCAVLYASDYTLLEPVLRAHGLYWAKPGVKIASLDHAFWWHRPVRADEWLLYVQQSNGSQSGRGLASGLIYTRDGELAASVTQEGMVRPPQGLRPKLRETVQKAVIGGGSQRRSLNGRYSTTWRSRYSS